MFAGIRTLSHGPAAFAAVALVLAAVAVPAVPAAEVAGCSGQPRKTVDFATGELRVYKSRSYACALAVARKPGERRVMRVSLQGRGANPVVDSGTFTSWAGPVTVHALNRCVRASGTVAGATASTGWILC